MATNGSTYLSTYRRVLTPRGMVLGCICVSVAEVGIQIDVNASLKDGV